MHGCSYRLCPPGVWSHGHMYTVWQKTVRMSYMSPVRRTCCAHIQGLICVTFTNLLSHMM
jgi:hypothetical protein